MLDSRLNAQGRRRRRRCQCGEKYTTLETRVGTNGLMDARVQELQVLVELMSRTIARMKPAKGAA